MTPTAEEALARALRELRVNGHTPIPRIEQRASQLRWQRRALGVAGAAVATAWTWALWTRRHRVRRPMPPTSSGSRPASPPRRYPTRCACSGQTRQRRRRTLSSPKISAPSTRSTTSILPPAVAHPAPGLSTSRTVSSVDSSGSAAMLGYRTVQLRIEPSTTAPPKSRSSSRTAMPTCPLTFPSGPDM